MHKYAGAIRVLKRVLSKVASSRRRGYVTLRLSVDLEHMGRPNESLLIAEGVVLDPWVCAGSNTALQRRVLRLSKAPQCWKVPSYADSVKRYKRDTYIVLMFVIEDKLHTFFLVYWINVVTWTILNNLCLGCTFYCQVNTEGRPLNCEIGAKNVFYGYDGELCGLEQLALQYYADEGGGWQGTHSEGGIWIFSDVWDVFQSKFQIAPLDLETEDFYKDLIESQFKRIQDGMAEEMLMNSWELHQGTSFRGVNWDRDSLTDLRAAVACVGGHRLALLIRHLALDYRSWSSRMPDCCYGVSSMDEVVVKLNSWWSRSKDQEISCLSNNVLGFLFSWTSDLMLKFAK